MRENSNSNRKPIVAPSILLPHGEFPQPRTLSPTNKFCHLVPLETIQLHCMLMYCNAQHFVAESGEYTSSIRQPVDENMVNQLALLDKVDFNSFRATIPLTLGMCINNLGGTTPLSALNIVRIV